ncbi:hypothetical protein ACTMTI_51345 [Nonomuraea sp. H19]|uniref:hypothetical protein n=1 Tax=Nonomuraea sp. H19 TaxID=3452206 RepID=UPI003F8C22C5
MATLVSSAAANTARVSREEFLIASLSEVTHMEVNTLGDDRATVSEELLPVSHQPLLPAATADAIDLLSHRWILQVLYVLCQGEARFQ